MSVIIRFDRIIQNPYKILDPPIKSEDDTYSGYPAVLPKGSLLIKEAKFLGGVRPGMSQNTMSCLYLNFLLLRVNE